MKNGISSTPQDLYLNLLKKTLTRYVGDNGYQSLKYKSLGKWADLAYRLVNKRISRYNLEIVQHNRFDPKLRMVGRDWPADAETMIGLLRLDNLHECIHEIIKQKVPGDFIETGVWRGGATIFMRAALKAYGIKDKTVWVADSFEGLPKASDRTNREDMVFHLWTYEELKVSMEEVKANFAKYDLLDGQVQFLKGWFKDTLHCAPIKKLALLRLDGDMYESTMDALNPLYPKLSKGGFVIVDDYCLPACKQAIRDFRKAHGIHDKIIKIDDDAVFWKKCN